MKAKVTLAARTAPATVSGRYILDNEGVYVGARGNTPFRWITAKNDFGGYTTLFVSDDDIQAAYEPAVLCQEFIKLDEAIEIKFVAGKAK
jgi:hypothetical protein